MVGVEKTAWAALSVTVLAMDSLPCSYVSSCMELQMYKVIPSLGVMLVTRLLASCPCNRLIDLKCLSTRLLGFLPLLIFPNHATHCGYVNTVLVNADGRMCTISYLTWTTASIQLLPISIHTKSSCMHARSQWRV